MTRVVRVTGVQTATASARALLDTWRLQFGPREYAVVLDLVARIIAAEQARHERRNRRWAA